MGCTDDDRMPDHLLVRGAAVEESVTPGGYNRLQRGSIPLSNGFYPLDLSPTIQCCLFHFHEESQLYTLVKKTHKRHPYEKLL